MGIEEVIRLIAFGGIAFAAVHRMCLAAERMFPGTRFAADAQAVDSVVSVAQAVTGATGGIIAPPTGGAS